MTPVTKIARAPAFDHERAVGRIRQAFRRRYEAQSDFAKALGWSEMKVSRILRGETSLDLADLLHVCKVLRLSADWVLGLMPEETFMAATAPGGLVPIPFVHAEAVADDLAVAASPTVCHLPAETIAKGIAHHSAGEVPGEWHYGRFALCDLSSKQLPPHGGMAVVDRRPCMSVLHGMTVVAHDEAGEVVIGRVYRVGETLTLIPEKGPPRPLAGVESISAAVVVLARPVVAVD